MSIWKGTTSGDPNVAANYEPPVVPVSGGTLYLIAQYPNPIDTNLDQSTATSVDVSAINTTTEVITTAANHGLADGQAIEFTTTDTLPTSSPQIVTGTKYFINVVDADELTVHTTQADAIADTGKIDFSDSGAGTHSIKSGIILAELHVDLGYFYGGGLVGTKTEDWQIGAALATIGNYTGPGDLPIEADGRFRWDMGSTVSTITVFNTVSGSEDDSLRPVRLLGSHPDNVITVRRGLVGLAATTPDEVSLIKTINIDYVDSVNDDSDVELGMGVTLTNLIKTGGTCLLQSASTLIRQWAGLLTTEGTGVQTQIDIHGGTIISNSTGNVTKINGYGGTVDMIRSSELRTLVDADAYNGFDLILDPDIVTQTNDTVRKERGSSKLSEV